jgi:hypothetical protein
MSMKASGRGEVSEIDRWDGGVGWMAHPEEGMQRASHALVDDGDVWVVDPIDAEGLDEFLADLGEVAGVVVLLDRHRRDCAAVARRHDVAVHVPRVMRDIAADFDAETAIPGDELGETGYEVRTVVDSTLFPSEPLRWREAALHDPDRGTLVIPESVGTVSYMRAGDERLGVHPFRRLAPPRSLQSLTPDRVLVGHGRGVHEDATAALREAIDGARKRMPSLYLDIARETLLG